MFKKISIILLLFQVVTSINAQEFLLNIPIQLKGNFLSSEQREVVNIKGPNGKLCLFLIDRNEVNAVLIDQNYKVEKKLTFPEPKSPVHKHIIGGVYQDGKYMILYADKKKDKFGSFVVDFKSSKQEINILDIDLDKDHYLQSLEMNGKFYILSIKKGSSIVNVYEYDGFNSFIKNVFDFKIAGFSTTYFMDLYSCLNTKKLGFKSIGSNIELEKVFLETENGLDITYKPHKLYYYDDKIIITSDNTGLSTYIMVMDLKSKSALFKRITQSISDENAKTNSYLYYDKLFQGAVDGKFVLKISDWENNRILKTYEFGKNDTISFKNSPIIQEGTAYFPEAVKELSKSKQLIRKMSGSAVALAVTPIDSVLKITIGSYQIITRSGGGMMPGVGGFSTPGGYVPAAYNPVYYSYSGRSSSKSAYFTSLLYFDSFEHKTGNVPKTAFDRIDDYKDKSKIAETIFKIDYYYVLGCYDKYSKAYSLLKFVGDRFQYNATDKYYYHKR